MIPNYYLCYGFECDSLINVLDASWNVGNIIKYVYRAGHKTDDPTPDIRKALSYCEKERLVMGDHVIKWDLQSDRYRDTMPLFKLMYRTMEGYRYDIMLYIRDYAINPKESTLEYIVESLEGWLRKEEGYDHC